MGKRRVSSLIGGVIAAGLGIIGTNVSAAENYPTRPVTIIVPFGPGGSADVAARILAEKLQKSLGQPFVVEDKPGAGAIIGTSYVARSAPDGYTLLVISNTQTVNETILKDKPYTLMKDFAPVAPINVTSLVLVLSNQVKADSVKDLIALEKKKPGSLNYASSGVGTPYHLAGELFNSMAGIKAQHVPYKSSGQARSGVASGEVDYMFDAIPTMLGLIGGKKVKGAATTGAERSTVLPNLPTMIEAGVPGYTARLWLGVLAPKNTPPDIVAKLNKAIGEVASMPDVKATWARDGASPMVMNPTEFTDFLNQDIKQLGKIARDANMVAK